MRRALCHAAGRLIDVTTDEEIAIIDIVGRIELLLAILTLIDQPLAPLRQFRAPVIDVEPLVDDPRLFLDRQAILGRDQHRAGSGGRIGFAEGNRLIIGPRVAVHILIGAFQLDPVGRFDQANDAVALGPRMGVWRAGGAHQWADAIGFIFVPHARHADTRNAFDDGHVERALEVERADVVAGPVGIAAKLVEIGLARGDGDRAGGRCATTQRALWAALHFDLADVVHLLEDDTRRNRRIVEIEFDRAVVAAGIGIEIDAAQPRIATDAIGVGGQFQTRRERFDFSEFAEIEVGDRLSGHRVDDGRDVLHIFFAAAGLHDDRGRIERGVLRRFLRHYLRRQGQGRHAGTHQIIGCHALHRNVLPK
ncbi:hypothetical protein EBBID32_38720 [Sphingobium indicum BiD32]|uniref:Uncharacterized protein n=1 Tax=Sphingobium indicum BiD32 TaxID=1301087 RepID=N1MQK0_9SPHN|nr:hypothetical protein EBBID32_38720 [Sphingobium indicum BiD32]